MHGITSYNCRNWSATILDINASWMREAINLAQEFLTGICGIQRAQIFKAVNKANLFYLED